MFVFHSQSWFWWIRWWFIGGFIAFSWIAFFPDKQMFGDSVLFHGHLSFPFIKAHITFEVILVYILVHTFSWLWEGWNPDRTWVCFACRRRICRGSLRTTCSSGSSRSYIWLENIEMWDFCGLGRLPGYCHSQGHKEAMKSPEKSQRVSMGNPVFGDWGQSRQYLEHISDSHKYRDENCPIVYVPRVLFKIDQVSSVFSNCCHATVGANSWDISLNFEGD